MEETPNLIIEIDKKFLDISKAKILNIVLIRKEKIGITIYFQFEMLENSLKIPSRFVEEIKLQANNLFLFFNGNFVAKKMYEENILDYSG